MYQSKKTQSGQVLIFFMLLLTFIMIMFAYVINVSELVHYKIKLQSTTDTAAYSGASALAYYLSSGGSPDGYEQSIAMINRQIMNMYIQLRNDITLAQCSPGAVSDAGLNCYPGYEARTAITMNCDWNSTFLSRDDPYLVSGIVARQSIDKYVEKYNLDVQNAHNKIKSIAGLARKQAEKIARETIQSNIKNLSDDEIIALIPPIEFYEEQPPDLISTFYTPQWNSTQKHCHISFVRDDGISVLWLDHQRYSYPNLKRRLFVNVKSSTNTGFPMIVAGIIQRAFDPAIPQANKAGYNPPINLINIGNVFERHDSPLTETFSAAAPVRDIAYKDQNTLMIDPPTQQRLKTAYDKKYNNASTRELRKVFPVIVASLYGGEDKYQYPETNIPPEIYDPIAYPDPLFDIRLIPLSGGSEIRTRGNMPYDVFGTANANPFLKYKLSEIIFGYDEYMKEGKFADRQISAKDAYKALFRH